MLPYKNRFLYLFHLFIKIIFVLILLIGSAFPEEESWTWCGAKKRIEAITVGTVGGVAVAKTVTAASSLPLVCMVLEGALQEQR